MTVSDRVWTLPNAISFLRLLGVPVFLYLVLVPEADGWAIAVLMLSGVSDYVDGYLARRWDQVTRLGRLLDPIADRLYIFATLLAFAIRDVIPWWFAAVLVGRDAVLTLAAYQMRRRGFPPLEVHFLGKAATFNLLYAFPLLLLGDGDGVLSRLALVFGWAFAVWGAGLYLWAGLIYLEQVRRILAAPAPAA